MTSVRRLDERLTAWRSFRGVARASRSLAAARSRHWADHVRHAGVYLDRCRALASPYPLCAGDLAHVVLAIGTDLGLCGPLNAKVAEAAADRWRHADFRIVVGRRLADDLHGDAVHLPAPTSFEAAEATAAELEALLETAFGVATDLDIVVTESVAADGTPAATRVASRPFNAERETPRVGLTTDDVAAAVGARLVRHARVLWSLCTAASSEAEVRWRIMHRAHDAADRRVAEQERELRKRRQEVLTQEMLEARQGGRMR